MSHINWNVSLVHFDGPWLVKCAKAGGSTVVLKSRLNIHCWVLLVLCRWWKQMLTAAVSMFRIFSHDNANKAMVWVDDCLFWQRWGSAVPVDTHLLDSAEYMRHGATRKESDFTVVYLQRDYEELCFQAFVLLERFGCCSAACALWQKMSTHKSLQVL